MKFKLWTLSSGFAAYQLYLNTYVSTYSAKQIHLASATLSRSVSHCWWVGVFSHLSLQGSYLTNRGKGHFFFITQYLLRTTIYNQALIYVPQACLTACDDVGGDQLKISSLKWLQKVKELAAGGL